MVNFKTILFLFCLNLGWSLGDMILTSPQVTNWGSWHDWEYCTNETYIIGMQLKTEAKQGAFTDDTALNGFKFYCDKIGERNSDIFITSVIDNWGSFGNNYFCDGVVTGFQMRTEKPQSVFADDTSANNLRIFCNGDSQKFIEGDGLDFGDWTNPQLCFPKQAFCGLSTQVEIKHGSGDETALNNIKVKCCDIDDPAKGCEPQDKWDLIIECDNREAMAPTNCEFSRKIGVSHSTSQSEHHHKLSMIYSDIGFSLGGAISTLASNFKLNLGHSEWTGFDWTSSSTEYWSEETTMTVQMEVPPGVLTKLYQTMGNCDFYAVRANRFRRVDTDTEDIETSTIFEINNGKIYNPL